MTAKPRFAMRYVTVGGVRYLRLDDVATLLCELGATEETDVRNCLEQAAHKPDQGSAVTTIAPKYPAARDQILTAVSSAKEEWPGLTWDSAPQTLLAAVEAGQPIGIDDLTEGCYWAADNSPDAQAARRDWSMLVAAVADERPAGCRAASTRLGRRVTYAAAVVAEARRLAAVEAAAVKARAEAAAELGRAAAAAVAVGAWGEALTLATQAAAIEREFGDAPSWGRLIDEIKALPEWNAEDNAIVDYHEGVPDASEAAAIECCGAVISASPQLAPTESDAREAWCTRFVAAYRTEIARWVTAGAAKE